MVTKHSPATAIKQRGPIEPQRLLADNWIDRLLRHAWKLLAAFAAAAALLAIVSRGETERLFFSLLAATLTNGALMCLLLVVEVELVCGKFLCAAHAIQTPFLLIFYFGFAGETLRGMFPLDTITASPFATAIGTVVVPFCVTLVAVIRRILLPARPERTTLRAMLMKGDAMLATLVGVSALFYLSFAYSTEVQAAGVPGYILRVLYYATSFSVFAAGFLARRFPNVTKVWVACLLFYVFYATATGSRGLAFIQGGLFLLGWMVAPSNPRAIVRRGVRVLLPLLAVMFVASGIISDIRDTAGRGGWDKVVSFSPRTYLQVASESIAARRQKQSAEHEISPLGLGFQRMVQWCNLVVPPMTPSQVPYRGFSDGVEEIRSFVRFGLLGSQLYHSTVHTNSYGFLSNEVTSVEFGLIADGWSRAGAIGAIIYGIIASLYLILHECLIRSVFRWHPSLRAFYTLVLINQCIFTFVRMGMVEAIRSCILYTVATTAFVAIAYILRKVITERETPARNRRHSVDI